MDHLLANGEKPIPEADDDDEEAALEANSAAEAKVRTYRSTLDLALRG